MKFFHEYKVIYTMERMQRIISNNPTTSPTETEYTH